MNMIELKDIMVEKVALEDKMTNVFAKSLTRSRFKHYLDLFNFVEEWFKKAAMWLMVKMTSTSIWMQSRYFVCML